MDRRRYLAAARRHCNVQVEPDRRRGALRARSAGLGPARSLPLGDNCRLCFLAVKDEYIGNDFPGVSAAQPAHGHNWLDIKRKERGTYPIVQARFLPVMCNHCDDAPCIKAARDGAVRKREDGIVIIDPEKSKGQKQIVDSCPYGAISWNEEKQIPQAWPFDAHLLDEGWTRTRGEQACPTQVFRTIKVDDAEMQRIRASEGLEVLKPELGTKPRVYYRTST